MPILETLGTAAAVLNAAGLIKKGAEAASEAYAAKKKKKIAEEEAKEEKKSTHGELLESALNRSAEHEAHGINTRKRLNAKKAQSMQQTADIVRGAFS